MILKREVLSKQYNDELSALFSLNFKGVFIIEYNKVWG